MILLKLVRDMVVDIDTKKLIKLGICAETYFILKVIEKKAHGILKDYFKNHPIPSDSVLNKLVEQRLIHNANKKNEFDTKKIIVRNRFKEDTKDVFDLFYELYNLYPVRVTRPDGSVDYLRTDKTRCRKLYNNKLKRSEAIHEEVMEYLRYEIDDRTRTGNMRYMKRMPKWLASEEWTTWKEKLEEESELDASNFGYGLKLE